LLPWILNSLIKIACRVPIYILYIMLNQEVECMFWIMKVELSIQSLPKNILLFIWSKYGYSSEYQHSQGE